MLFIELFTRLIKVNPPKADGEVRIIFEAGEGNTQEIMKLATYQFIKEHNFKMTLEEISNETFGKTAK